MGCRCYEISCCTRDLSILSGTVQPCLNIAKSHSNEVDRLLRQGSGALGGALSTNNLPLVQALLAQENRQPDGRLQDAVAQCGSEIRRVSSLLAQFRSEDQAYHAALAAAAAAAAAARK